MVISRWCTAPACGSLIGATPSSPSLMLMTPCCLCLVSTWVRTTPRLGKSLSSVWVGTKKIKACNSQHFQLMFLKVIFSFHKNNSPILPVSQHTIENYSLLSRVRNKPYDVFGCWLNETHLISGNLHWIGNMTSCSVLWLNKAFQVRLSSSL